MSIIPWRNKRDRREIERTSGDWPLTAFRSEMDRLFDRFFGGGLDWDRDWMNWMSQTGPAFDVSETEKEIIVKAELPGVEPKDIDLTVSGNMLTVSGEKKETTEENEGSVYRSERRFGSFRRSIELPGPVDADKVAAEHKNGVLTIKLPREASARPKRIAVSTGGAK